MKYYSESGENVLLVIAWRIVDRSIFRFSPGILYQWRVFLLRLFGAKIGKGVIIYSSVKIWAPWNFEIGDGSALGNGVVCYCVDKIKIGDNVTISQYTHLCAATRDYTRKYLPLIKKPIIIESNAWVCTGAFIGPGVKICSGAVVGARAVVIKDVPEWKIVAGNPAKIIKDRIIL